MRKKIACGFVCMALALLAGCRGGRDDMGSEPGISFADRKGSGAENVLSVNGELPAGNLATDGGKDFLSLLSLE